ncbi:hypothetical protein, partial [Klebsiella pneumoniae]
NRALKIAPDQIELAHAGIVTAHALWTSTAPAGPCGGIIPHLPALVLPAMLSSEEKRAQLRQAALEYHEFPTPGKVA